MRERIVLDHCLERLTDGLFYFVMLGRKMIQAVPSEDCPGNKLGIKEPTGRRCLFKPFYA
jgi:hypothetical protein